VRRFLIVVAVGLIAAWGLGALVLLADDDALPDDADAVVVLTGSDRNLPAGQALVGGGIAPLLVVASNRTGRDQARRTLCRKPPEGIVCIVGGPFVSGGELQAIARVVRNRNWNTVVVVSPSYQRLRVDRVLGRCADVEVVGVGVDDPWWRDAIALPLEWVKLAVAETVRRRC
jgi:hypothetical protein